MPGENYFVISSDKRIFSCIAGKKIYNKEQTDIIDDSNNNNTDDFQSIIKTKLVRDKVFENDKFLICKKCNYYHVYCEPCPLYSLDNLNQCKWAIAKFHEMFESLMNFSFSLNENSFINNGYIYHFQKPAKHLSQMIIDIISTMTKLKINLGKVLDDYFDMLLSQEQKYEIVEEISYLLSANLLKKGEQKTCTNK